MYDIKIEPLSSERYEYFKEMLKKEKNGSLMSLVVQAAKEKNLKIVIDNTGIIRSYEVYTLDNVCVIYSESLIFLYEEILKYKK